MGDDNKVDALIDAKDWGALIAMALNANAKAAEGVFCSCDKPDVTGRDLMCVRCGLEVEAQRERRVREMREPHPYEPMVGHEDFGMCGFCSRWQDDPIHTVGVKA